MRDFFETVKPGKWETITFIIFVILSFAAFAAAKYGFAGNERAAEAAKAFSNAVWFGFFYGYVSRRKKPKEYYFDDGE